MPFACLLLQTPPGPSSPSPLGTIIPMVGMVILAYVLLIRPVQKQRKEQQSMRDALKAGDEVLTSGGLYGTVTKLREGRVSLRVSDGVQVEVARVAVVEIVPRKESE